MMLLTGSCSRTIAAPWYLAVQCKWHWDTQSAQQLTPTCAPCQAPTTHWAPQHALQANSLQLQLQQEQREHTDH
jgi:hypothetical protein